MERENGLEIWLANLTSEEVICDLDADIRNVAILDEANFVAAASDPNAMTSILRPHSGKRIALAAYAVARLRI
ncbi:hypothetical protein [Bradyrhizobium sp. RDM4]|uniref:hypothetical protein n=1 Tax=Bradyrhizobium sp. RDM4 TaxID=3378765 RepID=UPI0038FD20AE